MFQRVIYSLHRRPRSAAANGKSPPDDSESLMPYRVNRGDSEHLFSSENKIRNNQYVLSLNTTSRNFISVLFYTHSS